MFIFLYFNISFNVPVDKSVANLIEQLLYMMSLLCAFKILFIFGTLEFKNNVYQCEFLCLTHLYFIKLFGFLDACISRNLGNFQLLFVQMFSLLLFPLSFLNCHSEYIGMIDSVPQDSITLFIFLYSFSFLLLHLIDINVISQSYMVPSYFLKSVEKLQQNFHFNCFTFPPQNLKSHSFL